MAVAAAAADADVVEGGLAASGLNLAAEKNARSSGRAAVEVIMAVIGQGDWTLSTENSLTQIAVQLRGSLVVEVLQRLAHQPSSGVDTALHFFDWAAQQGFQHTSATYSEIISILSSVGKVDAVDRLLQSMHTAGCIVTSKLLATVVQNYGAAGLADQAVEVFQKVKQSGKFVPHVFPYNALINVLVKAKAPLKALEVFQEMRLEKCKPDSYTYTMLIDGLGKAGKVDEVDELFLEMVRTGIRPHVVTYSTLVLSYCRAGNVEGALYVLEQMKAVGTQPNAYTYNIVVDALCKGFRIEEAWALLNEMKGLGLQPSVVTLNSFLQAHIRCGEVEDAVELFEKMCDAGCAPNEFSVGILLEGFQKAGKTHQAHHFFQGMVAKGMKPTVVMYATLIKGYLKSRRASEAVEALKLYEELTASGLSLAGQSLTLLIDGLMKAGEVMKARDIYLACQERGDVLDVCVHNAVIDGLVEAGQVPDAFEVLKEMRARGCACNVVTYNILIKGLCKTGELDSAQALVKEMGEKGCEPDVQTYNTLLGGFCKNDNLQEALVVMDKASSTADAITYRIIVDSLCKAGRLEEAYNFFEAMEKGPGLDNVVCGSLVTTLCRLSQLDKIVEMVGKGQVVDAGLFNLIIPRFCEDGRMKLALDYFTHMKAMGRTPKAQTYAALCFALCNGDMWDHASELSDEMVELFPDSSATLSIRNVLASRQTGSSSLTELSTF